MEVPKPIKLAWITEANTQFAETHHAFFHVAPFSLCHCSRSNLLEPKLQLAASTPFQTARQKAGETESRNPDLLQQLLCVKSYFKSLNCMLRDGLKSRLKWECNFVVSYNAANLRNNVKEISFTDTLYHTENYSKF